MNISFNIYFIYGYEDIIFSYLFSAKNNWNVDVQTELLLPARPKKSITQSPWPYSSNYLRVCSP